MLHRRLQVSVDVVHMSSRVRRRLLRDDQVLVSFISDDFRLSSDAMRYAAFDLTTSQLKILAGFMSVAKHWRQCFSNPLCR